MKRSELYALVWQISVRRAAHDLGLSDVGLRKVCARFQIPVPDVGYWAKRDAGHEPEAPVLLRPNYDPNIPLPNPQQREQKTAAARISVEARAAQDQAGLTAEVSVIDLPETLEGCLSIVKKTADFFHGIEKEMQKREAERAKAQALQTRAWAMVLNMPLQRKMSFGRFLTEDPGCLCVAATLSQVDWILRFHEALIRSLIASGCRVTGSTTERGAFVTRAGGRLCLNFAEQVEKLAKPSASGYSSSDIEYRPLDRYRLKLERRASSIAYKHEGSREDLEAALPSIVREMIGVLEAESVRAQFDTDERAERDALLAQEQAERGRLEAEAKRRAELKALADAQVAKARNAAQQLADRRAIEEVLELLSTQDDSDGVRAWIGIVRSNLSDPVQGLHNELRTEIAQATPPAWLALLP
ncbi:hypothetical protein PSQ20_21720 [Curvibacter sp. RS43]|uniref:hypothetical protein n=1 Tax=Curvibacter microcysteis TaxID=3026419 RepID=UPI00236159DD|nr:hypothetical protein [Curvibacter sp. RS43]MDD0812969.1 hypothetical protein [Curvibacter sp. RS43]